MSIARHHPCNAFGWLWIPAEEARQAMAEQLRLRDAELRDNKHAAGEPHPMRQWAIAQVARLASQDRKVAEQIHQRRDALHRQIERLESDRQQREEAHKRAMGAIERDLQLLDQVMPTASTSVAEVHA